MSLEQKQNVDVSKLHDESALNNNEIKVFEKLQILLPPNEANKYKTVCEEFEKFLERDSYNYRDEVTDKLSDTHEFLWSWIAESKESPKQVLDLVKHIFKIVIDKNELKNKVENVENKDIRSWLVLATLFCLSQVHNLTIEGTWEEVLYELIKYTRTWDMDEEFSEIPLSDWTVRIRDDFWMKDYYCWNWMVNTACSSVDCPNPYLRLEFFRLILLFDEKKHLFSFSGKTILTGYIECMSSINPEKLFVIMGNNIFSMRHLMLSICSLSLPKRKRLKHVIGEKVVGDLHLNQIGKEVQFVANSLKVIGMFAEIAKKRYKAKSNYLRCSLNICMYMLMFGHKGKFSENIYNHKLLLPYTCGALADITDGILTLSASFNDNNYGPMDQLKFNSMKLKRISLYNKVVKRRNDLINDLDIPNDFFLHVKICQREQSNDKFCNNLLEKKALALVKLELGTICSDEIKPMSYYNEDNVSHAESADSDDESWMMDPRWPNIPLRLNDYDPTDYFDSEEENDEETDDESLNDEDNDSQADIGGLMHILNFFASMNNDNADSESSNSEHSSESESEENNDEETENES